MESIVWPTGIDPKKYPVHSRNQLFVKTQAKNIWQVLVRAQDWPHWYPNSKNINLSDAGENLLQKGTKFTWETFGLKVISEVIEYEPCQSIGWTAKELGGQGYHGWRIIPEKDGYLIITEEVQRGWGIRLLAPLVKYNLQKQHQIWLEQLKLQASRV